MPDLDVQIRHYIEAMSPPLTTDEIIDNRPADVTVVSVDSRRPLRRGWLVGVAAAAVVLVLGLALILVAQLGETTPPATDPTPTVPTPTVVEEVETVPSPSTTLLPEAVEPSAPITGMAWQQVTPDGIHPTADSGMTALVSGGDRFLYVDVPNDTVGTSFDGISWTTRSIQGSVDGIHGFIGWHDTLVGFGCGGWVGFEGARITPRAGCVSVIHPDGTVARQSFDAQINSAGIGPAGMVVIVTNNYDEDGLQYANVDEMAEGLGGRDINDFRANELTNGVLHLETLDGQVSDYVIADHGYTDSESQVASGWFSHNGEEWIPIPEFPAGKDWDLIGTEDGFVAISDDRDGDVVVWHSSNGLEWRELGQSPGVGTLSRWSDGAVVTGTESYWYLSAFGIAETSLAITEYEPAMSASGTVGMVRIHIEAMTFDLKQILYSPKGEEWINTNVPPEMSDLELTIGFHLPVEAVATDTNVILLLNEASSDEDGTTFVWFLGTPITG